MPSASAATTMTTWRVTDASSRAVACVVDRNTSNDYRQVAMGVRAPRVAVLVRQAMALSHWHSLIEALTSIWGGGCFALVPTDGDSITPLFARLIDRYDPDFFLTFADSVSLSARLQEELRRRSILSPYADFLGEIWPENAPYPLTHVEHALGINPPRPVLSLRLQASELLKVLVASATGALSDESVRRLAERQHLIVAEDWSIDVDRPLAGSLASEIFVPQQNRRRFPFDLSLNHLGLYVPAFNSHPLVVVVGDTLDDFAYFWTLRSLRSTPLTPTVYWLPRLDAGSMDRDYGVFLPRYREALRRALSNVWRNASFQLTSVSLKSDIADLFRLSIDEPGSRQGRSSAPINVAYAEPSDLEQLLPEIAEHWEVENTPNLHRSVIQFHGGRGMTVLEPPLPVSLGYDAQSPSRWMVDVYVEGLRLPSRSELTPTLTDHTGARVSRSGLAFTGVSDLTMQGVPIRALLVRPTLLVPTASEVFESIFARAGLALSPSDKGRYEREFVDLAGDLDAVRVELQDDHASRALFKFVDDSPNRRGVVNQGARIGGREGRVLDLVDLKAIFDGNHDSAVEFLNRQLRRSILERGLLIIKCPRCRRADWYPFAEIADSVRCHRCGEVFVFPAESGVYYRLNEMVAQALRHNSHVSLLTLARLSSEGRERNFINVFGSDLKKAHEDRVWLEIDFALVSQGFFKIGECKLGEDLSNSDRKQLDKYVELCLMTRPHSLIVATAATRWSVSAVAFLNAIRSRLEKGGVGLEIVSDVARR
jgi:ribosomal protein S27E